jgi:hypothetical protein
LFVGMPSPPATFVSVSELASPEYLVEIEGVVAVPAGAAQDRPRTPGSRGRALSYPPVACRCTAPSVETRPRKCCLN